MCVCVCVYSCVKTCPNKFTLIYVCTVGAFTTRTVKPVPSVDMERFYHFIAWFRLWNRTCVFFEDEYCTMLFYFWATVCKSVSQKLWWPAVHNFACQNWIIQKNRLLMCGPICACTSILEYLSANFLLKLQSLYGPVLLFIISCIYIRTSARTHSCTRAFTHSVRYGRVVVSHKKRELNSLVTSVCVCVYSVSAYTKCD